jgi:hypothetical protein
MAAIFMMDPCREGLRMSLGSAPRYILTGGRGFEVPVNVEGSGLI